jgi:WD40 repeat protein
MSENSPPESPFHRRTGSTRDENVFNRLTSETKQSPMPESGNIKPYSGNTNRFRFSPVTLTHVAEGHSKAILSVDAHDFKFFTGSKDRTAKVWDLITGQEIASLTGHINNVSKIKYCPKTQLCFTVSSYYAKVWDLRASSSGKCVKTLNSSGLAHDGDVSLNLVKSNNRILQNEIPFGEKIINDLVVDSTGSGLYTASGSSVKVWDLRQFVPIGKLSGGHSASITTMLVDDNFIITGSKDHYIKIFELSNSKYNFNNTNNELESSQFLSSIGSSSDYTSLNPNLSITSKYTLTPPHYDGVQSLCRFDDYLFSCSRDMCIKKWSMNDFQSKQSVNNAHKDWICSLDYLPSSNANGGVLLSGCRGGYLKFWNMSTLEKMADFRAHLCPINSIKCNKNMVFTASDDATVRIWRRDK